MKTIASKKFTDPAGNVLFLKVTTAKKSPYVVSVAHQAGDGKTVGVRRGTLSTAGDERTAREKLDRLAEQAVEQGWKEVAGRAGGLTEIPAPVSRPGPVAASRAGGGGHRRAEGEALIAA